MTDQARRTMKAFEAKVRQLISLYQVQRKETLDLYVEIERKDAEIERLKVELDQSKREYANLKLAKMIDISDDELKGAKQRITGLVKEVNKCIAILTSGSEA
jgi:predicted RNase H-like nuclease (RuvC/YqgF family)